MILSRASDWYRPYSIYINNNNYVIDKIFIYDENGIITQCSGWFETRENDRFSSKDIESINLPVEYEDILLKRKEDFNIKKGFIISKGKDYNELKACLYLHKEVVGLKFIGYIKEYDSIYEIYKGYVDDEIIDFRNNVKFLKNKLYDLTSKFDDIVKNISSYDLTQDKLDTLLKDLKKSGNAILKEKEYINNYNIEDFLKEIGENE